MFLVTLWCLLLAVHFRRIRYIPRVRRVCVFFFISDSFELLIIMVRNSRTLQQTLELFSISFDLSIRYQAHDRKTKNQHFIHRKLTSCRGLQQKLGWKHYRVHEFGKRLTTTNSSCRDLGSARRWSVSTASGWYFRNIIHTGNFQGLRQPLRDYVRSLIKRSDQG